MDNRSKTHFRNSYVNIKSSHCVDGGLSAKDQAQKDMDFSAYLLDMEKEILFIISEVPPIIVFTNKL